MTKQTTTEGGSSQETKLSEALRKRLMRRGNDDLVVLMDMDETEDVIRLLWEFCGHMGEDVVGGGTGYEHNLLERARSAATQMQAAMLVSIQTEKLKLVKREEDTSG